MFALKSFMLSAGQVTRLVGALSMYQKVVDSISRQGAHGKQLIDISLLHGCFSPSFSPFLSLKPINISLVKMKSFTLEQVSCDVIPLKNFF